MYHRWWVNSSVPRLIAMREWSIEYFLWGVSAADEVDCYSTRITISKLSIIATIVDDIFYDYATPNQLKLIKHVIVQGWDVSIMINMRQNFKMCLKFFSKL